MKTELKRLTAMLSSVDPTTDSYSRLLGNIFELSAFMGRYGESLSMADFVIKEANGDNHNNHNNKLSTETKTPNSVAPIVPKEEPIVITSIDEVLTKDVVRGKLHAAAEKGVPIQPIIARHVPEGKPIKFSSIPESEYNALVKELYDAK